MNEGMIKADLDYKLFFELSPDLLCIAGFDGYFRKVNPAVSKVLGYTEEELYSRPIDSFVYEADRKITSASRNRVITSQTLFHFENRYVTKSGELVWLAWTSLRVNDDRLIFAIAKDITHKKKLESERLALMEDLAKVNQDLQQFTLTSSHDLRSPISNLIMVFDLLDVSKISDHETVELIELLKLTGGNLKETLNSYVDALSEKIGRKSELQEVDLRESLKEVLSPIDSLITSSETTIRADFSEARTIRFDRTYLASVFMNLITNSIKYSRPGISPEITIRSEKGKGSTRLIFEDNGLGFDLNKVRNRIFGINQTFHGNQDSKGVGLYLVHSHITSLGGEIRVESEVDRGTRFTMSFPDRVTALPDHVS